MRIASVFLITGLLTGTAASGQELERLEKSTAAAFGTFLSAQFAAVKDLPVALEPDVAGTVGLAKSGQGIILVPAQKIGTAEADPKVDSPPGVPLAYLFLSPKFDPVADGQTIAEDKLRRITISAQGQSVTATALILTLRRHGDDDWRLAVYGAGNEPIAEPRLFPAEDKSESAIDMHVQDAHEKQQTLVIKLRGQYEVSMQIGNAE